MKIPDVTQGTFTAERSVGDRVLPAFILKLMSVIIVFESEKNLLHTNDEFLSSFLRNFS